MSALPYIAGPLPSTRSVHSRPARALPVFDAENLLTAHQAALAQIAWAVAQVPAVWHHRSPGGIIVGCEDGAWSVAENLAHLFVYEELNTLPALATLAGRGNHVCHSPRTVEFQTTQATLREYSVADLLAQLWAAHERLAMLARTFTTAEFTNPQVPAPNPDFLFDRSTPGWLVAKSVQHFWEHGATMQRVLLFATSS